MSLKRTVQSRVFSYGPYDQVVISIYGCTYNVKEKLLSICSYYFYLPKQLFRQCRYEELAHSHSAIFSSIYDAHVSGHLNFLSPASGLPHRWV